MILKKKETDFRGSQTNKRFERIPKFKISDLVRTADLIKAFSKRDATDWYYKSYTITKITNDTIPSYYMNNLHVEIEWAFSKKTALTMKEKNTETLSGHVGFPLRSQRDSKSSQYGVVHHYK